MLKVWGGIYLFLIVLCALPDMAAGVAVGPYANEREIAGALARVQAERQDLSVRLQETQANVTDNLVAVRSDLRALATSIALRAEVERERARGIVYLVRLTLAILAVAIAFLLVVWLQVSRRLDRLEELVRVLRRDLALSLNGSQLETAAEQESRRAKPSPQAESHASA